MSVDTQHPEYKEMLEEWQIVKACCSGQSAVKKLKTKILPAPGADSSGSYDIARYSQYIKRAIYTNVTGRTQKGLSGAAFRLPPDVELPAQLQYLEDSADGAGQSIEQLSKDVLNELLCSGREALLVDYPEVPEGITAEEQRIINPMAYIKRYSCFDVINWRTDIVAGREVLTLAVLRETYEASVDEFSHNKEYQYRVLRLTDDGYSQSLYQNGEVMEVERFPTKSDGSRWERIPLFFVGSQCNDASVDPVPLSDIAFVNVGHFRNSADLEESSYIVGQPMLHIDIGEMDDNQWKTLNPNGVAFGSSTSVQTIKGNANILQVSENQLSDKLQERKEGQMLALGAKLVEKRNPNETAAAAKIDATGENSVLSDLVANVEEGIRRAIEWCGEFMGVEVDAEQAFTMNRQFFDDSLDPQSVIAAMQMYDRQAIAKVDLIGVAKRAGYSDRSAEEIMMDTGQASPLE